jgi:hypothetical protein
MNLKWCFRVAASLLSNLFVRQSEFSKPFVANSCAALPDGAFSNQKSQFWRALDRTMLIYFMDIWTILRTFAIFYDHFWYILCSFGTLFWFWCHVLRKNLATLLLCPSSQLVLPRKYFPPLFRAAQFSRT